MNQEGRNRKEKPKWDAFHFRLPREKDQLKFIELYRRSGAKTKTDFIRRRVLGEEFHVVTTDVSKEEYYRTLTVYLAQLHKLGVLYNQAVRTLNSYHSAVVAKILTEKLERLSQKINANMEEVIRLTKERQ